MDEEKELNIHEKILAITNEIGNVPKEDIKVNNQYRFVSHQAVTDALRPLFIKYRLTSIPTVIEHQQVGNNTVVTVEIELTNVDKIDDKITIKSVGYGTDKQDKGPGKAISYAVKNAYLKLFNLATGDEDVERDSIDRDTGSSLDVFKAENSAIVNEMKEIINDGRLSAIEANRIIMDNNYSPEGIRIAIAGFRS